MASNHGKKYVEAAKLVDPTKAYTPEEAIDLAKQTSYVKFDPTVEVHLRMGVDPRHADQQVRGVALLPNGLGKEIRVLVFVWPKRQAPITSAATTSSSASRVAGWISTWPSRRQTRWGRSGASARFSDAAG